MLSMPDKLSQALIKADCDISVWEHCLDILEEERWNEFVVLSRDIINENQQVKILRFINENRFKIENQIINSTVILEGEGNE